MEEVIVERNSHHLNQTQSTPLTVEPLLPLIGTDSFTYFSQELLNGTLDNILLPISPTMKNIFITYNKTNKSLTQKQIIIFYSLNTNKDSKYRKNQRQPHRQEGV